MILKLSNKENTYTFTVDDLNNGEKLYYKFQIPASDVVDGKYNMVLMDDDGNIITEEQVCMGYFNAETIQYNRGENVYINSPLNAILEDVRTITIDVPNYTIYPSEGYDAIKEVVVDAQPVYDNGYNQGSTDGYDSGYTIGKEEGLDEGYQEGLERGYQNGFDNGVIEQKNLLTNITITENGTYTRDNGYNTVVVDIPDTNGSYDEGYQAGIEYAAGNAEEIAAANAIDLVATEFRTYYTKYSDNIVNPNPVTGIYPNFENFYNAATIVDKVYNTGIMPNETTKLEFWFKRDDLRESWANVIAASEADNNSFRIRQNAIGGGDAYVAQIKNSTITFNMVSNFWCHIEISYADGLIINDNKIGDFTENISQFTTAPIFINGGQLWNLPAGTDDGNFGMIKITQDGITNVIIPTADGLKNITTDEMLEVAYNGGTYEYINNDIIILDNLIKSVDVQPKIDVVKYGIRFGYSTFTEIPNFYDFSNVSDMSNMFINCNQLIKLPNGINGKKVVRWNDFIANTNITSIEPIDTSLCIDLSNMFAKTKLITIPYMDTSNATSMRAFFADNPAITTIPELDTRNVQDMYQFFYYFGGNKNLLSLPKIYCDSCNNMGQYFSYYADGMSNLTEVGGWINLKCNWNDRYGLPSCNNLTYQSCINILNGLYDFTGNGETPASNQGNLKVHPNFLTTVGDEISIGTNKGWSITA